MSEELNEVMEHQEPQKSKYHAQIKYFRNMYNNNEEFRNKQKQLALNYYNKIREEQIERYKNDEEYRKKRAVFRRNSYLKLKARKQAEAKKKEEEQVDIMDFL